MKILINIGHPAHVHFYKNFIWELKKKGHDIKIVTEQKDVAIGLLNAYNLEYEYIGTKYKGMIKKGVGIIHKDYLLYKIAKKFKPDIITGILDTYGAHVGMLIKKPSIVFTDTEHAKLANIVTLPFASAILTPSCFKKDLGKKQVRYDGYHELAYLHPNYFTPDPSVLDYVGLSEGDKFIIVRFVAWEASHDVGQSGISDDMRVEYISKLEQYGRVFISSEAELGKDFEKYKLKIPPEKFHSLLSYAELYIGESGAISTEAGILGVPSVYVSSLAGTMGNFDELEKRYGLMYSFQDSKLALVKALELLEDENTKKKWQKKREKLFNEKIDVTKFMTEFIEGYPESFENYK
jgi:predicted glycosyltransferase